MMPGGFREYIRAKATELRLGGFIQRTRSKLARVVIEGAQTDIFSFIDVMDQLSRDKYISAFVLTSDVEIRTFFYRDFKILKSCSRSCKKGHRSPSEYECSSSSVSSADREASFERPPAKS
jgi:hypothetical protein